MPVQLERKSFPVAEFKVLDTDLGIIEAYVAVFGNVDYSNDVMMPGFFAETIATGKLPKGVWMHDLHAPIAKTLEAEEVLAGDPRLPAQLKKFGGLRVKGQLNLNTQRGREAFEDLKFGTVDEFSFGYIAATPQYKDGKRYLYKGMWFEWSPVTIGDNPLTTLVDIKEGATRTGARSATKGARNVRSLSLNVKGMFETALAERTNSLYNLFDILCSVLCQIDMQEDMADAAGVPYDYEGAIRAALAEFTERVVTGMVDEEAEEESAEGMTTGDGQREAGAPMETAAFKPHRLADGWGGYAMHLKAVADAAAGIIRRTEERKEMRTKQNRMLSAENELYLAGLADNLDVHAKTIREMIAKNNGGKSRRLSTEELDIELKRKLVETRLRLSGTLASSSS